MDNGADMTMIVSGILLKKAVDAAAALKEQGVNVRVLDMATIKPLDSEAVIKAAKETGAIMTIEDHTIFGGLGSAVSEVVSACERRTARSNYSRIQNCRQRRSVGRDDPARRLRLQRGAPLD